MKNMKKIASVLLAVILVLAMSVPAFAAEAQTGSIIINSDAGREFDAYKILDAKAVDAANPEDGIVYSIPDAMKGFYNTLCGGDDGVATVDEVVAYLEAIKNDGTALHEFAEDALAAAKAASITPVEAAVADGATSATFADIPFGYYVIEDVTAFGADETDTVVSALMLDTTNSEVEITVKKDLPTVDKFVDDINDSTKAAEDLVKDADYDIGDDVPFTLVGTVADNIALYDTYSYKFVDTLAPGLTFKKDTVKVYIDGVEVAEGYVVSDATAYTGDAEGYVGGTQFTVSFADLKAAKDAAGNEIPITENTKVTVEYMATLNEDAVIAPDGNPNKVYLEYANNPNGEGTGKTEEKDVIVYTYKLVVEKVDGEGNPLEGAGFTLYKEIDGEWVKVGEEVITALVDGKAIAEWKGLDDGKYMIEETTVPAGYNKAADVDFVITANPDGQVTADKISANAGTGTVSTKVENKTGSLLPETGGMGTTMFYMLGGLLVVGAAILLVSKKRMAYEA